MDRADRNAALAKLTREELLYAIGRIHDALYEVWVDKGPAGEGFEFNSDKEWSMDTLEEVAAAICELPGLRPE